MKTWRKFIAAVCAAVSMTAAACTTAEAASTGIYRVDNNGVPVTVEELETTVLWSGGPGVYQQAVIEKDGKMLSGDDYVATGQTIQILDHDVGLTESTVVVVGDVTGTGAAGLPQLIRMAKALDGSMPLEGIYLEAGDITGDGKFGLDDLVQACAQYEEMNKPSNHAIESRVVPLKFEGDNELPMLLYFMDGVDDIPWVSLDMAVRYWNKDIAGPWGIEVSAQTTDETTMWTRSNGSTAIIDCEESTITFSDYDAFMAPDGVTAVLDVLMAPQVLDATGQYLRRAPGSFGRSGHPVTIDAAEYGIQFVYQNGQGYIPKQTFEDVFMTSHILQWAYNGEAVFQLEDGRFPGDADEYYSLPARERSEELCLYNYRELCLMLDMLYGLKEQHDITDFDALFNQTGLTERLLDSDAVVADTALNELCLGYLADLHSSFIAPSHYAGKDADVSTPNISASVISSDKEMARLEEVRDKAYPNGVPGYEEVGDTAYVTFDEFIWPHGIDYYSGMADDEEEPIPYDTVGLIMYAHKQITRPDSPIRNVVLDLTNNYGGSTDAAMYVIGWFLGGEADMSLNSTLTGAQATTKYQVDVNADGQFDENDSVQHLNRYCLVSQNSYSCGNLVPAAFKASNQVTLLGRTTGGGACLVQTCSTADGTLLRISGPLRMSTLANGAFYDVDRGIIPDVIITKFETYYDRQALNDLIENLSK